MKKITYFIIILLSFFATDLSYSYTPSSYVLIQKILKQFSFDEPVIVEQNIYHAVDEEKKLLSNTHATIKYPFSLRIKLNAYFQREYVINDDDVVEIYKDTIIYFNRNMALFFYDLFSFNNIQDYLRYLEMIQIDHTKVTLGLLDGKLYYVIGTENLNDKNNRLLVDKESYLPKFLVLFYSDNGEDKNVKYEFSGYSSAKRFYFPNSVRYYNDDVLNLEFETTSISHTTIDSDDMFNTKKIRKEYKLNTTPQDLPTEE